MTTTDNTITSEPVPASPAKALADADALALAATPTAITRTVTTTAAPLEGASFRVYFADAASPVPGELRIVVSAGQGVGADLPISTVADDAAVKALLARAYLAATGAV